MPLLLVSRYLYPLIFRCRNHVVWAALIGETRCARQERLRLYLNRQATIYDWDAWKCHGTCLTSGSALQAAVAAEKNCPAELCITLSPPLTYFTKVFR